MHDKKKIYDKAIENIQKQKLMFVEDIVASLPISKQFFYDHFPIDSDEYYNLKELLDENRVLVKQGLRKKWFNGNNASTQIALYKIIGSKEDRYKLNGSEELDDNKDKDINITFDD